MMNKHVSDTGFWNTMPDDISLSSLFEVRALNAALNNSGVADHHFINNLSNGKGRHL